MAGTSISGSLLSKATTAGTNFGSVDMLIATPLLLVQLLRDKKVRLHATSESCKLDLWIAVGVCLGLGEWPVCGATELISKLLLHR